MNIPTYIKGDVSARIDNNEVEICNTLSDDISGNALKNIYMQVYYPNTKK